MTLPGPGDYERFPLTNHPLDPRLDSEGEENCDYDELLTDGEIYGNN